MKKAEPAPTNWVSRERTLSDPIESLPLSGSSLKGTEAAAILVPQRAVSRDEKGQPTVLVVGQGGKIEQRALTAPRTVGENWLVTAGLKPGDKVIVEGAAMLRPGTPVTAVPWNPNAKPAAPAAPAQAK